MGLDSRPEVATIVHARIRPGAQEEYERRLHEVIATASGFEGHLDATVLKPGPTDRDYVTVFRFESDERLRTWLDSPERHELIGAIEPLVEAIDDPQSMTGLETWFDVPGQMRPPPARKMAPLIMLGTFPIALAAATVLRPTFLHIPTLPRVALVVAIQVTLLTWVVMPLLSRAFAPWLSR